MGEWGVRGGLTNTFCCVSSVISKDRRRRVQGKVTHTHTQIQTHTHTHIQTHTHTFTKMLSHTGTPTHTHTHTRTHIHIHTRTHTHLQHGKPTAKRNTHEWRHVR